MKKLSLRVLISAVALCSMVQVSHGMKREWEVEQSPPPAPLIHNPGLALGNEEQAITPKQISTDTVQEIFPCPLFNDVYSRVLIPLFNLNPQNPKIDGEPIIQLRAVSRGFKKVMDSNTKHLDLSGFYWRPRKNRPQQNEIFRDADGKRFKYCDGQLFLGKSGERGLLGVEEEGDSNHAGYQTILKWILYKPEEGKTLWSSDKIYLDDSEKYENRYLFLEEEILNPLKTFFTDLSMDLTDFSNLTSLNLSSNTGFLNWDQRLFTNLTSLNLSDNGTIDDGLILVNKLKSLYFTDNGAIISDSDAGLRSLTYSINLDLNDNNIIIDDALNRIASRPFVNDSDIKVWNCLAKFKSLYLSNQYAIRDDVLSLFTNLTSLNLRNNKVITDKSVGCLTKLEALDLSVDVEDKTRDKGYSKKTDKRFAKEAERRVPLKVLHALPNLKTLTLCPLREDIGECIHFPGLRVNFWSVDECPTPLYYQQTLHIADALFSYIENEMSEYNSSKISQLKDDYLKVILWPTNKYNLTSEFLKPDSIVSMTAKEIKELLNSYEDSTDGEYTYDYQVKLVNIINELLEISKKDLNISYFNSEYEEDKNLLDPSVEW